MIPLPRLLVIDDLFGRTVPGGRNRDRVQLCGQFLIEDVTGDESGEGTPARIREPIAEAVFVRGQTPAWAEPGDKVENDLAGTLRAVAAGWDEAPHGTPRWALVLLDLCFYTGAVTAVSHRRAPGMPAGRFGDDDPGEYFGLEILRAIRKQHPDLPVVILSSKPRDQVSQEFSRLGAVGFIPRAGERSPELLRDYIWRHGLIPDDAGEIVGRSSRLLITLRAARRAAADGRNVLILGERGTGKELVARYIHRHRIRPGPLVVVDSGALNPHLYASELFGHRKGAFTGADRDRVGRIAQAEGGDLFLDEIGNMPSDVQTGLLRVLEQRQMVPVGDSLARAANVRFLAATNENLEAQATTGGFRQDLLDRIRDGGTICLPPLRERSDDLPELVERFVRATEAARPGTLRRRIDSEVMSRLSAYDWPGNVRELASCIHGAVSAFPDVEHLVTAHLQLGRPTAGRRESEAARAIAGIDTLLRGLADIGAGVGASDLADLFAKVRRAYQEGMGSLLRAALLATCRTTIDTPDGRALIHPAAKLLIGDRRLTASQAADLVKRLLAVDDAGRAALLGDPLLAEAYRTAHRLRPSRPPRD